jgi:fluoroacetyl-CoA thioesterase
MKPSLVPGIEYEMDYMVPPTKTVPALYPESAEFQEMPEVFATGYLVGLLEWTCVKAINPHLDWPREQTVGTHVNVSHTAATPPGLMVKAKVRLVEVQGRRLVFEVEARAEAAARAGEHDGEGVVVGADFEDRIVKWLHGVERERVHALGALQCDQADVRTWFGDLDVGHGAAV